MSRKFTNNQPAEHESQSVGFGQKKMNNEIMKITQDGSLKVLLLKIGGGTVGAASRKSLACQFESMLLVRNPTSSAVKL